MGLEQDSLYMQFKSLKIRCTTIYQMAKGQDEIDRLVLAL